MTHSNPSGRSLETEGVIQFTLDHTCADAPDDHRLPKLGDWRNRFRRLGMIGQDPRRYGGLGFGNLSIRQGSETFLITGSQTAHHTRLLPEHMSCILEVNLAQNWARSLGPVKPSSESLSHAAAYQAHPDIHCVFHVHDPRLYRLGGQLGLAATPEDVHYGTPAMAYALAALLKDQPERLIVMAGHLDGLMATGRSMDAAGALLLSHLREAEIIEASR